MELWLCSPISLNGVVTSYAQDAFSWRGTNLSTRIPLPLPLPLPYHIYFWWKCYEARALNGVLMMMCKVQVTMLVLKLEELGSSFFTHFVMNSLEELQKSMKINVTISESKISLQNLPNMFPYKVTSTRRALYRCELEWLCCTFRPKCFSVSKEMEWRP
jgi:hypothetical protein